MLVRITEKRTVTAPQIYKVEAEPGDGTRYQYIMRKHDNYIWFYSDEASTITYPKFLFWNQIRSMDMGQGLNELARHLEVNPWTLTECINSARDMYNEA